MRWAVVEELPPRAGGWGGPDGKDAEEGAGAADGGYPSRLSLDRGGAAGSAARVPVAAATAEENVDALTDAAPAGPRSDGG